MVPITVDAWLTSSGRYPARAQSLELVRETRENAALLCRAVSNVFTALGITEVSISSGFRPLGINAKAGGAKRSGHIRGLAVDLVDANGELAQLLSANPALLRKYGLFLENPKATPGWVHLDIIPRVDRPSRIFNP